MILENKLGITNQAELASQEKISKSQAKKLFAIMKTSNKQKLALFLP